jgi:hypothetical protein
MQLCIPWTIRPLSHMLSRVGETIWNVTGTLGRISGMIVGNFVM